MIKAFSSFVLFQLCWDETKKFELAWLSSKPMRVGDFEQLPEDNDTVAAVPWRVGMGRGVAADRK